MNITVTLFHGLSGWVAAILGCGAITAALSDFYDWLDARWAVQLWPLRIVRASFAPGWVVTLPDGRRASVIWDAEHDDAPCDMLLVQPESDDPAERVPEWAAADSLLAGEVVSS